MRTVSSSSSRGPVTGRRLVWLTWVAVMLSLSPAPAGRNQPAPAAAPPHSVIPAPASIAITQGQTFAVTAETAVYVQPGSADLQRIGEQLAALLGHALEEPLEVRAAGAGVPRGSIYLAADAANANLGEEGYELTIGTDGVRIVANRPAGAFYGMQTLRHLLPASIEHAAARPRPVTVPHARIVDRPRFEWRGAMLDVARHFFGVADVKRYLDLLALYKINRLHLHLSDDQGWRIEIKSWPKLAAHGGSTQVGGGPGGFYTQAEFADLVAYARDRFITVVPEIDVPGHTNAALASYGELNCDGVAPPLYTGIEVGFSSLCVDKDVTYRFLDDVVREIAAMTSGPYFHAGGDEVKTLTPEQYQRFIERVQAIVQSHGKQMIGWDEVAAARLAPTSVVQHWRPGEKFAVPAGVKLIVSPANKAYLDMKYHPDTALGLNWAGYVDVPDAYTWDPSTVLGQVPEDAVLGVEAPLWSETLTRLHDIEYMAFPRLAGVAEIGWSPATGRTWDEFSRRLGAQAQRWSALGVNAYWSPRVPWRH